MLEGSPGHIKHPNSFDPAVGCGLAIMGCSKFFLQTHLSPIQFLLTTYILCQTAVLAIQSATCEGDLDESNFNWSLLNSPD